jgi:hypothetical protein
MHIEQLIDVQSTQLTSVYNWSGETQKGLTTTHLYRHIEEFASDLRQYAYDWCLINCVGCHRERKQYSSISFLNHYMFLINIPQHHNSSNLDLWHPAHSDPDYLQVPGSHNLLSHHDPGSWRRRSLECWDTCWGSFSSWHDCAANVSGKHRRSAGKGVWHSPWRQLKNKNNGSVCIIDSGKRKVRYIITIQISVGSPDLTPVHPGIGAQSVTGLNYGTLYRCTYIKPVLFIVL